MFLARVSRVVKISFDRWVSGIQKRVYSRKYCFPNVYVKNIIPETIKINSDHKHPSTSIIIICDGQIDFTLNCLASIADNPPRCSIEVIVVDDSSNDPRLHEIRFIPGIVFIENKEKLGFLRSCNLAAKQASGNYLYFLNNNTILCKNTIDALVDFFDVITNVGMVGSRLVYPDGCQKEAGSIVWNDASTYNYGRFDDYIAPQYQYVREVDYFSAGSALILRSVWNQLGGFDEIYTSCCYYAYIDFSFRVRSIGKNVYFQPNSSIYQFDEISRGNDLKINIETYQAINQKILFHRWSKVLARGNYSSGEHIMRARDRCKNRKLLLIIDQCVPAPDADAGSRTMIEFIKSAQMGGWIVKFWPQNLHCPPVHGARLQQMGVEVFYKPYVYNFDVWIQEFGRDLDAILLSRPNVAPYYLQSIRKNTKASVLYYGHDLHFARLRLEAAVTGDAKVMASADKMEKIERSIWRDVDCVLYPSKAEINEVRRLEPGIETYVVPPYCFDSFEPRLRATTGKKILFVAGFAHPPNVDAAIWWMEQIFPIVKSRHPDACVIIAGAHPKPEILKFSGNDVSVTGWISAEHLRRLYSETRVVIVPLRFGAGVKLKVVEALVEGVPIVTTPIGAQGLENLSSVVSVESSVESFAAAVSKLLDEHNTEWLAISERQLTYAKSLFGRKMHMESLLIALEKTGRLQERCFL